MHGRLLGAVVLALVLLGACGDDGKGGSSEMPADADPAVLRGEALSIEHRCTSCHSIEGAEGVGPPLDEAAGAERILTDGTTVVADTEYLVRAIVDPRADVVEGYPAIMGSFAFLEDDEVSDLVAYIEALTDE